MIVSRETDYAIRIIRVLSGGERLTIVDIAEQEFLPKPFAYKILRKLATANIVTVFRGRDGGIILTRDTEHISMYDVMYALSPESFVSSCLSDGYFCSVRNSNGKCNVHKHLLELQASLDSQLKNIDMASLLKE